MLYYYLTDNDIEILQKIAQMRATSFPDKAHHHTARLYHGEGTPEEMNYQGNYLGVVGEYVFAKMFGGFFDHVPRERGDDHDPDVVFGSFMKSEPYRCLGVEVKTTPYLTGRLAITTMDQIAKCDWLALCIFDPKRDAREVIVAGWISKEDFLKHHYRDVLRKGNPECMCYDFENREVFNAER